MPTLLARVTSNDRDQQMPPPDAKKLLTSEEVATLRRWVEPGGAL